MKLDTPIRLFLGCLLSAALIVSAPAAHAAFQHAEARHTHPVALNAAKTRLVAVDSLNARLSVFDVSGNGAPVLLGQIPTGLEPVSVRFRTDDEVWVVNELSDSITLISLDEGGVLATLPASDEPADVVFAQGKAFVSCARNNSIRVFDASTRAQLAIIPVEGIYPRALAVNEDGSRVYAAFFESGNRTTILPKNLAPPQPAPANPELPAPPQTALIVAADDSRVTHDTLDQDVVEINTTNHSIVGYASGTGTSLFDVAVRPGTGDLWVANTEAQNLIRYEPNLRGRFALNRVTRIAAGTGAVTPFDLNPGLDYDLLPNPAARATALAQPASLVFSADGSTLWIAAFASDRIAKLNASDAAVLGRTDLRTGENTTSSAMRGPRGLALDEGRQRLYVLNKLAHTLGIVSTDTLFVTHETPVSPVNPMPKAMREGQGFLYDARLSGNGTVSCGICHFDADRDGLAWDLGDPGGQMMTVLGANLSIHDPTPRPRVLHPMKGPMTTQTLRGMQDGAPFHWRGDRATVAAFNPTFNLLMGGTEIADADMQSLTDYLQGIVHHPNPNRNADRSLPTSFAGGNPVTGRDLYKNHTKSHCAVCHVLPTGSDNNIDLPQEVGSSQPLKTPPLRTVYQRLNYNPRTGQESLSGFGMLHDGTGFVMPIVHPYVLDDLNLNELQDVTSFLHCFDTGVAPAVGKSMTLTAASRDSTEASALINLLETRATATPTEPADCDLIVRGRVGGVPKTFLFLPASKTYRQETAAAGTLTRASLLALLGSGDSLTFLGTLPDAGSRFSVDEDEDGFLNGDDPNPGEKNGPPVITREPEDRAAPPGGSTSLTVLAEGLGLSYQWYKGTEILPSATSATLTLSGITAADAGSYRVTVQNISGTKESRVAKLEVYPAPAITKQPVSVNTKEGINVSFTVTATGSGLSYQWRRGTAPVGGATDRTLKLNGVSGLDIGTYNVVVRNGAGSVVSEDVTLSVQLKPVMAALNLPRAIVGQDYSASVTAAHAPTRFSLSGLPAGLKYDAATGVISGRPTLAKVYFVKATASNAAGTGPAETQELTVDPFPESLIGTFEGIVPRHERVNGNLGGRLKITVAKTGAYSGSLTLGATTLALKGGLTVKPDLDPAHILTLQPKGKPEIKVSFSLQHSGRTLSGTVETAGDEVSLSARLPDTRLDAYTGNYTLALPLAAGDRNNDTIPQGDSHGGIKISNKGAAAGVIFLADGTKVTFAGPVAEAGRLHFHSLLYSKTGSAQGVLVLGGSQAPYRLQASSQASWFKQDQARFTRLYQAGFGPLNLQVIGGSYSLPANDQIALNLPAGPGNARLIFEHGGAPVPAQRLNLNALEIQSGSPAKVLLPSQEQNPGQIKLTVTPGKGTAFSAGATGVFKGSFALSDTDTSTSANKLLKRTATFTGALVDDGTSIRGYGFFILAQMPTSDPKTTASNSPQLSGKVRLEAAVSP